MTSKQSSIYTMGRQVVDLLNENQAVVQDVPGLPMLQTEVTNELVDISSINSKQQSDSTVITSHKASLRVDTGSKIIDVNNKMLAFAIIQDDSVLSQKCGYTIASLQRLNDNDFVTACEQILKLAHENMPALKASKVTDETLALVRLSIDAFVKEIDKPQETRKEQKQYTAQMVTAFTKLLTSFDKMDIVVEAAKNEYSDFYNLYQDTRNVNVRHGSLMAQGYITDAKTGKAVIGATVSFVLDGTEVLIKTSGDGGGFKIKSMDEGSYSVTVTKTGYQPQTITLHITYTELTNIEVKLVHL